MVPGSAFPLTSAHVAIDPEAFIHPTAQIYGKVRIGAGASVWPNAVIRAEAYEVVIGPGSNIQDFVMLHVGSGYPTIVGANCSITHRVTLHGCTLGDNVLVGIGATIMDGSVIGENSIIAGGAFLKEGTIVPPNSIVAGVPAVVKATRDSGAANRFNAWIYQENAKAYARGEHRAWAEVDFAEAAVRFGIKRG